MKTAIIIGIILIIIVVLYFVRKSSPSTEGVADISAEEGKNLIKENKGNVNFVILDVRTPEEFRAGHIAGAVNIDYHAPDFKKSIDTLERNKTYLLYCRSGNRSAHAATIMKQMNFTNLHNLKGGMLMWRN